MISFSEAMQIVGDTKPILRSETLPVDGSLVGRVLLDDLGTQTPVPSFASSGMDGYVLTRSVEPGTTLEIVGQIFAGKPYRGASPGLNETLYIATGALVPDWGHSVIPIEKVSADGAWVAVKEAVSPGANIRPAGQDFSRDDILLSARTILTWGHLALLYGVGIREVTVAAQPALAIVASGDEIVVDPDATPGLGQVYDVNRPWLSERLTQWYTVTDACTVSDDQSALEDRLRGLSENVDVLVLSGGMSVGKKDFTRQVLEKLSCDIHFHRVAQKPGKPILFGTLPNGVSVIGLPGNPAAALAGACLYLRHLAYTLAGATYVPASVALGQDLCNSSSRTWLLWGTLATRGKFVPDSKQNSHLLGPAARSTHIAILPRGQYKADDPVSLWEI